MVQPHILCKKVSERVMLPGDPKRVDRVAEFLEGVQEIAYNREFKTIIGKYKGVEVTVTSTGIGGASATIALEELIACGGKFFIRIGSAGAIQKEIKIGDLIISIASVREDGASQMYVEKSMPASADFEMIRVIENVIKEKEYNYHMGITRSHDSFYVDDEMDRMKYWNEKGILGSDMETSALYTIGYIRRVKVASILNNVLYESDVRDGINEYVDERNMSSEGERREIEVALESLIRL